MNIITSGEIMVRRKAIKEQNMESTNTKTSIRCQGTTRAGTLCKKTASVGSPYCSMHQDPQAKRARESDDAGEEEPAKKKTK